MPAPITYFLHEGLISQRSPNSALNWGPSLQITELREEHFSFKPPMAIKGGQ